MKRLTLAIVAFVLTAAIAFQLPLAVGAAETAPDYICEVKVGMAKEESDAKSALEDEGFTVLDCNLNQGAEGGFMSKGKKAVYLGYKTTKNPKEAITDLAVMNMKGGYKTKDYDSLMKDYLSCQIIPFVEGFLSAINEYRENYNSKQELAKLYDDDANKILDMWNDFKAVLDEYDDAVKYVEEYQVSDYEAALKEFESIDDNTSESEKERIIESFTEEQEKFIKCKEYLQTIAVHDALKEYDYGDGTLLDFFNRESDEVGVTEVYPMVASLTDGQRSGLNFVSLKELCLMAITNEEGYEEINTQDIPEASIYDGVDRAIYEKGGVGLTGDTIRTDAAAEYVGVDNKKISTLSIALWCSTGAAFVAMAATAGMAARYNAIANSMVNAVRDEYKQFISRLCHPEEWTFDRYADCFHLEMRDQLEPIRANSTLCRNFAIGFGVAMTLLAAVSLYFTFRDMYNYYQTEFTPQPRFIVEESDITDYNKDGDKIVVKNQTAYYKLAETNRSSDAEFYNVLGTGNDLNGDVGKQWLSLYYVKNAEMSPILADSIKAVVGSTEIPAGYETGIHMFGEDTAYNLNNSLYVWSDSASSVTVYFNTESSNA